MFLEILAQSWQALRRHPTRSLLTMFGIVWGIVTVALLMSYGSGFRELLLGGMYAFGRNTIIVFPGQTSQQAGGERAGKRIFFETEDVERIRAEGAAIQAVCLETIRRQPVSYAGKTIEINVRGVCPEYGEMRSEVPSEGRWIGREDYAERRRVVFLGGEARRRLFGLRPVEGERVQIAGVSFLAIGAMDFKIQFGNYYGGDNRSVFIPYTAAAEVWNARYATCMVMSPHTPQEEDKALAQLRSALAKRQRFQPNDPRAIRHFGSSEIRGILDGITIGLQVLLLFIGTLTLGIGGVGLMNIMLVSVDERVREIGLRIALGARRSQIRNQFLAEALMLTLAGGLIGIALAYALAAWIGPLPMLGALARDDSGKGDLVLHIDLFTTAVSAAVLLITGVASGLAPAMRAARLDPSAALRYE